MYEADSAEAYESIGRLLGAVQESEKEALGQPLAEASGGAAG